MENISDTKWLYELLEAFDELVMAARAINEFDDEDEQAEILWKDTLNSLSDAVNIANTVNIPNIQEWITKLIETERQRAIGIIQEEMDKMRSAAPCREPLHWVMTRILSGSQSKNTVHKID